MNITAKTLPSIFDEWTDRLQCKIAIAGGCVRDVLMKRDPKDVDIFVLDHEFDPAVLERQKGIELKLMEGGHDYEPFMRAQFLANGTTVQVMDTGVTDTQCLLDGFDWNVSRFAYDGEFTMKTKLADIRPGKPLKLHRLTYPAASLRRGFRFSERFGMRMEQEDLHWLCSAVVSQYRNKGDF